MFQPGRKAAGLFYWTAAGAATFPVFGAVEHPARSGPVCYNPGSAGSASLPARYLDLGLIVAYLITITIFGAHFRHRQRSLKDYFLGGREAPWWAISLSIVAAETSTLTIIGTPALAFDSDLRFLQLVLGYLLARILVSFILIPQYFRGQMYTAYELIRRRFGERLRRLTAATFLVTRSLAEGVRVFAIALVVSVVLGTGEVASIVIISVLTIFYTFEGGMTAVIWTDVVQMFLYAGGGILSLFLILSQVPGGWGGVEALAEPADKFRAFDFSFALSSEFFSKTYTFWAGLLGGCFLNTATHGTDQLVVQRLLSARNERESKAALIASWAAVMFQFVLFLVIGVALYAYYQHAGLAPPEPRDRLYPGFVWANLPPGAAGVVIASIFAAAMSTLSASLNSLASATVVDFLLPAARKKNPGADSEQAHLKLSRWATLFWGAVLVGIAILARKWGSVLEAGLAIASVPLGALLGVFGLGVLTRRAHEIPAMAGMGAGLAVVLYLRFATPVAWTWYVVAGASVTFAAGYALSLAMRPAAARPLEES